MGGPFVETLGDSFRDPLGDPFGGLLGNPLGVPIDGLLDTLNALAELLRNPKQVMVRLESLSSVFKISAMNSNTIMLAEPIRAGWIEKSYSTLFQNFESKWALY